MKKWLALLLVFIMLLSVLTGCAQKSTTVLEPVMEAPNSIVDAQIDEHGDLILYMTDGTTIAAGHVRGEDGEDGSDGVDGVDGKDGHNGIDGKDGRDGIDGKDGVDGKDGIDGINGADGADGKDGADGVTPTIGENGNWWIGETDTGVKAGQEEFIFDQNGEGTVLLAYVGTASEVTIPEKCTEITASAFKNNRAITSVIIPESVSMIGNHAFDGCIQLSNVKFPEIDEFDCISGYCFNECGFTEVTIPDSIEFINDHSMISLV